MAVRTLAFFDPGVVLSPGQESKFFNSIRISNGVFKTTGERRMDDLNAILIDALREADAQPCEVLDLGASSGITSVELIDTLLDADIDANLTATDVSLFANLVRLSANHHVLTDGSGEILQNVVFGVSLRSWPRRLDTFTGYWLVRRIANRGARAALARARHGQSVMLVSARARAHPRITFVEDDILSEARADMSGRFNVVRAANVLNRNYFGEADLRRAVTAIKDRMRGAGSILVVARTSDDGQNHGTVFRLNSKGQFDVITRIGKGSEIETIVLGGEAPNAHS